MPVQKVMNIVAITGTYQKDGQEKKKYLTVGALFIYDDGGMSIKLEAVPTNFDGNLSVYERDNNQSQGQQPQQQQSYQQQQQNDSQAPTKYQDKQGNQQSQQQYNQNMQQHQQR